MSCKTIESMLALYMDNALTPVESREVDTHLENCPACSSLLAELRRDRASLQSLPSVLPPAGFRAELLRKAALAKPQRQSVVRYLVPRLSSLAAAIMVVLLASNLYVFPHVWPRPSVADDSQMRLMAEGPSEADAGTEDQGTAGETGAGATSKSGPEAQLEESTATNSVGEGKSVTRLAPPMMQQFSALGDPAPEEEPNLWLWSSVAGAGLFGLGTGFFVFRYRRI